MCLILVLKNKDSRFFRNNLDSILKSNPDGVGILADKKVYKISSSKSNDLLEFIDTLTVPAVLHFRLATVGGVNTKLTHPFQFVLRGRKHYLFHNGHYSQYKDLYINLSIAGVTLPAFDKISDSWLIAKAIEVSQNLSLLDVLPGKFAVCSNSGSIITYGQFSIIESNLYSNQLFQYINASTVKTNYLHPASARCYDDYSYGD